MVKSLNSTARMQRSHAGLERIVNNIALSMVGRAVDVLVGSDRTRHGIVSGVQMEAGTPKLIVAGRRYNLNQVLTAMPATLS